MHGSSGCLGYYIRPKLVSTVDEPRNQKPEVKVASTGYKESIPESFWTTSDSDINDNTFHSPGSISSFHTPMPDPLGAGSSNASSKFVNHGFLLWNQNRRQWLGIRKSNKQQLHEPKLSYNESYYSLLGSNKPFPKPIPLGDMVDFLVDVWEQDGMYD